MGPAGLPAPVVARLGAEIVAIVASPDMRARLAEQGSDPVGSTPTESPPSSPPSSRNGRRLGAYLGRDRRFEEGYFARTMCLGPVRRNMLDRPISQGAEIQAAEERFPLAKRNGRNGEVDFIDVAGLHVLLHRLDTAANLDVLCAGRIARLLQRLLDAA